MLSDQEVAKNHCALPEMGVSNHFMAPGKPSNKLLRLRLLHIETETNRSL
jgi:hypothetical protein